jgi:hypothetical protein
MSALPLEADTPVRPSNVGLGQQRTLESVDEIDNIEEPAEPFRAIAPAWLRDGVPIAIPAGQPRAGRQNTAPVRMYLEPG